MNKFELLLAIVINFSLLQSVTSANNYFCFPLCTQCWWGPDYDQCTNGCRGGTGFSKPGGASTSFACTKTNYNYYSQTSQKWQPCGRSPDIPSGYNMGNSANVTVQVLTINPSTTDSTCTGSNGNYVYYGNLTGPSVLTISHPGIIDNVFFWYVRLMYEVITFDKWPTSLQIKTQFNSNMSEVVSLDNINNTNQQHLCGSGPGNDKERYNFIKYDYRYSDKGGFEWNISTTNDNASDMWGVLNVIVSIRLCHPYCTVCTGDGYTNVCTECNFFTEQTKLSGSTCTKNCLPGYGDDSANPPVCITCDTNCKYCQDTPTNCLDCYSPYLLYNSAAGVTTCVSPCPSHYFPNTTANDTCMQCDPNCLECNTIQTKCTSCYLTFYLYQTVCYSPCPYETYSDDSTQRCYPCNNYCSVCSINSTYCSVCDVTGPYISYLKNGTTCVIDCGLGLFQSNVAGANLCVDCDSKCSLCDVTATNCSICNSGFYLLASTCDSTCPFPEYFTDDATWKCLDCATYCVTMTMSLRWGSALKQQLICDLEFSQSLSWGPTEIAAFLKVTVDDPTIDLAAFNFVYEAVTSKIMRLTLSPKGFTFIYNVTFHFKTVTLDPANYHHAANNYRFSDANYDVQMSQLWFLIKAPSLSENEKNIMDTFANLSTKILSVTTLPYVQEIKKAGLFAMLMSGAQATSTAVLVNTIPSQNFYEGVRFWASFVFFDVPPWEQGSKKTKYVVVPNVENLIKDARLMPQQRYENAPMIRSLFDTNSIQWRFQRTGHTTFFIFDTYMNIFLIVLCWILLTIAHCCIKHKVTQSRVLGMFYSFTIKVHEITIFYISLTTLLQWLYFDAASLERWISLGMCILFNAYFLFYELYIYYDMINYPTAHIGNKNYDYYVVRYGSLLKNVRFQEYDPHEQWSVKHWFRPYNYHIMSYYKKFLMMIALPIFYSTKNAQIGALIIIQLLEMVRFIVIWPFYSKVRNFIRLGLELCLLIFFGTILIQAMKLPDIMSGDPALIQSAVQIFYKVGWAGFGMVFVFNLGHIIIWIYDIVIGCRKTNRQMMDQARKFYYMRRLQTYEEQNEDVPLALVNKWVKLGNLNDRKYDMLPDLNLRVEYFKILKTHNGYEIDMKKLFQIFMNIEFNYQKQNNISAGKKLNKRFNLTRSLSPTFYSMIENLYHQYITTMDFEYLTIKTFQKVIQSNYTAGDKIPLEPEKMEMKIQLETFAGQKKVIKLNSLLPGFPLSYDDLRQFV